MRQLTSANSRMWASYNRRRAKNRAADTARRRERAEQRAAEYVARFAPGKAPSISRKRHGFRAPIEAMIDAATGKQDADMQGFLRFVWNCVFLRTPAIPPSFPNHQMTKR